MYNNKSVGKNIDNAGHYTDCHFLIGYRKKLRCNALREFYHADDPFGQCIGCPFYKTTEEFRKGWKELPHDAFGDVLTALI